MARAAEPAALVQARETFYNGTFGEVRAGDLFWNDDPVVKALPHLFGPVNVKGTVRKTEPVVEQATAAPGEKRGR